MVSDLTVSIITLAEACWIIEHRRTSIPDVASFLRAVDADPRIRVVSLDRDVLDETLGLTRIGEMHDRQIVATALLLERKGHEVVLLTKDSNICSSGLVATKW